MNLKDLLKKNILEYVKEAREAKLNNSFNSAVTLFFKAMAVMVDCYILDKEGIIPNSHTERFDILKSKYHEIYLILDKDFPLYQKTYRIVVSKEYGMCIALV